MKTDKILELSLLLEEIHKEKEEKLLKSMQQLLLDIQEFNGISDTLNKNFITMVKVYEEEITQHNESTNTKLTSNPRVSPYSDINTIQGAFDSLKEKRIEEFRGNFDLISKIYFNDKLTSNLPEKNTKNTLNKI